MSNGAPFFSFDWRDRTIIVCKAWYKSNNQKNCQVDFYMISFHTVLDVFPV